ncbi:MAG: hypothetical protein UX08_C0001G0030 [Candidatus Collierbacteria bacterium GW2011_GWB1_45_35]|uniref:Uncharacterized protein n=2 Tax=Candidatus Collieribacteriota TaxID=1752725 RepID=A0A0G1NQE6_9BACT|nr:MAG: hypothetical protein UW48_C0003G0027 [Microgenomates group bacterium GW2011_GWC1_44_23]KKT86434.1 MAG: hypothetical protein UW84_C0011G0001 [Candidatus Collierbacteria bacterium GW2011_GWA2_44_99]KKT95892.1 MAG: hypothetical protein UW96_C0003G0027 [Candidatus Collierbacteria bacterium GW2011_GWA1_45_15]KKU01004.1 MAG: hypothetical protein UX01_C0003G0057 [Candidatus Collierbacteria bacterium GW2011_GWB2_45_17]KKU05903.1 MAG: hypothetical protein UX08_C0001G0030 [Candidatus Collierbacte
MSFVDVLNLVLAFFVANAVCAIIPIILSVALLVVAFINYSMKERKSLKKFKVTKLRDYRYVSQSRFIITLLKCAEIDHVVKNKPEWATDGVFVLRQIASKPEDVGAVELDGRVSYTLDRWCNEADSINARTIRFDPTTVVEVK